MRIRRFTQQRADGPPGVWRAGNPPPGRATPHNLSVRKGNFNEKGNDWRVMIGGSTVEMGKDMQVTIKGLSKENMQKKKKKKKKP